MALILGSFRVGQRLGDAVPLRIWKTRVSTAKFVSASTGGRRSRKISATRTFDRIARSIAARSAADPGKRKTRPTGRAIRK
jgi:hypothetical protein